MAYQKINIKTFLSRIERDSITERPLPFTWLIGAGFSASAGIPLAKEVSDILVLYEYIGENEKENFEKFLLGFGYDQKQLVAFLNWYDSQKASNPNYIDELKAKAYKWLSSIEGFQDISRESPECYQALFTHLLKFERDHHYFLTSIIHRVKGINVAHIGLAGLLRDYPKWGDTVFTTNFDDLLLKSILSLNHTARIFGELRSLEKPITGPSYPQIVHLHGRHTGYNLLNTKSQVSEWYSPELKDSFAHHISQSNLLIIGYSGWDDMIIQTLTNWNNENSNMILGNLYWVPFIGENTIEPKIKQFLNNCPQSKTFVITNSDNKELNADSFILSLCNSINRKNGSFAAYRRDILETAKHQHGFIMDQLKYYPDDNPELAIKIADEAESLLDNIEIEKSLNKLELAQKLISQPDVPIKLKADVSYKLGTLYYKSNEFITAEKIFLSCHEYYQQIANKDLQSNCNVSELLRLLAEVQINLEKFDLAYENIKSAIHTSKQILLENNINRIKANLVLSKVCRVYLHLLWGNMQTVDKDLKEIDDEKVVIEKDFIAMGKLYQLRGCYMLIKNNFDLASSEFDISNEYYSKTSSRKNIILNQVYQSYIALREKYFESAIDLVKKQLEEFRQLKDIIGQEICASTLIYFESLKQAHDSDKIIEKLEDSAQVFIDSKNFYNAINVLTDIYNIYESETYNEKAKDVIDRILKLNMKPHQYFRNNKRDGE